MAALAVLPYAAVGFPTPLHMSSSSGRTEPVGGASESSSFDDSVIIAFITDTGAVHDILTHLGEDEPQSQPVPEYEGDQRIAW